MTASDKCTNLIKYVLLCRSHPHRTFAWFFQTAGLSAMCEFVQTSMSRPQRKSGPTGRTAALLGEGERQLLSLGVWVKLIFLLSFGSLSLIRVTLLFAVYCDARTAQLRAYVGLGVESLALRHASSGAADTFSFFHKQRWSSFFDQFAACLKWTTVSVQPANLIGTVLLAYASSGVKISWVECGRSTL